MKSSAHPRDAVRIAVFAKAPVPGAVKTRLAPLLGAEGAAGLHAGLVRHALATAVQVRLGAVELWCAPDETHPFFARCAGEFGVGLRRQEGIDLGERMRHAFEVSLAAKETLVLIGSDCPALRGAHLAEAAQALRSHDAVIAPAEDGGYVLVGLAKAAPQLFDGVAWGTAAVMAQTRARIAANRIRAAELATLWDVDRPEDYARLKAEGLFDEVMS
jgi:uncharacterized protein